MSLTYLTDLPGVGGVIKQRPEDFLVEEQPLYDLSGEGEHLYLFIEKTQATTSDVVRRLAQIFGIQRGDVGYAGMKDKQAVTRQHFSVRTTDSNVAEAEAAQLLAEQDPRIKILWADRHRNKLRRGHLAGNRFVIRIRNVDPLAAVNAKRILDELASQGVPNYVGEQRFGYRGTNHLLGRDLLLRKPESLLDELLGRPLEIESEPVRDARAAYDRGDYEAALQAWPRHLRHERQAAQVLARGKSPNQAVRAIERMHKSFLVTAAQSYVFNQVLDRRLRGGTFAKLLPGDLAWKHDNGAVFSVDDATAVKENADEGRVASLEVSPSGPMWGPSMTRAQGDVAKLELEALQAFSLTEADLEGGGNIRPEGVRRPLRVAMRDPDISSGVDDFGSYVRVAFELPRGAFATMVLRELMKNDVVDDDQPAEE